MEGKQIEEFLDIRLVTKNKHIPDREQYNWMIHGDYKAVVRQFSAVYRRNFISLEHNHPTEPTRTNNSIVGKAPRYSTIQLKPMRGKRPHRTHTRSVPWSAIKSALDGEYL